MDRMQPVNNLIHLCSFAVLVFFLSYQKPPRVAVFRREALAPFLKHEEARLMAEGAAPTGPFQYVLCAATSPAVKQQDESLTYLNQGRPLSSRRDASSSHRHRLFLGGSYLQLLSRAEKM